jgi:putative PEP-CTERM system histidine kinase
MGGSLIFACTMSAVWAGILAAQFYSAPFPPIVIFLAEVARSASWIAFLVAITTVLGVPRFAKYLAHLTWSGTLVAGAYLMTQGQTDDGTISIGAVLFPGGLVMALAGLVLVEQLYRNSPASARNAIRYLAFGVGAVFAYDLFLYSEALMTEQLASATWGARGIVNALIVPLIAVSAQRNPQWDVNVFVSRQVVFFSTTLLAVGAYLLLMSLGGYYIILVGGSWGGILRIVFLFGAALVLTLLLFSNTLRSQAKVFLIKHFFRNKYDYREEWLRLIATLSTTHEGSTGKILIKAIAQMVDSPGGVLWRFDDGDSRYLHVASFGTNMKVPDLNASDPLIEFMKRQGWLVDLNEYAQDQRHYGGLILPQWTKKMDSAWLFLPLISAGRLAGIMMLLEPKRVSKLNYEDRDLVKTAGQHVAVHLAQEESDRRLAEAQQFEAYNRLTAFLMHDLKNLVAQQTLIVQNAEKHRRNPVFVDDAMVTIANSVKRMNKVLEQLARERKIGSVRQTPLKYVVSNAADRCDGRLPSPKILLDDADIAVEVDPDRLSMVLQNLIRNAQDATDSTGSITLTTKRDGEDAVVLIKDDGCGMTSEFIRDRLFRPFDSTKGSQGMGIGAHQAREFVREMGGDLKVQSVPGEGTTLELRLPMA